MAALNHLELLHVQFHLLANPVNVHHRRRRHLVVTVSLPDQDRPSLFTGNGFPTYGVPQGLEM